MLTAIGFLLLGLGVVLAGELTRLQLRRMLRPRPAARPSVPGGDGTPAFTADALAVPAQVGA